MGCTGSKKGGAAAAAPEKTQQLEGDFKITLERTADEQQALGLSITAEGAVINVLALKEEGLVPDFIKATANVPEQHVKEGDRIIAVNGVSGDVEKMKAELNTKTIVLTVQRPSAQKAEADGGKKEEVAPAAPPAEEPAAEPATVEEKKQAGEEAAPPPAAAEEAAQNPETVADKAEEKASAAEESQEKAAPESQEAAPTAAEAAPAAADAAPAEEAAAAAAEAAPAEAGKEEKSAAPLFLGAELAPVEAGELGDAAIVEDAKEERLCKLSIC